jgi:16S rRNA (cytosine967-C5)-methyltransferase
VTADPARRAAYRVVLAVDTEAAYANLLLPRILRDSGLTGRDAAFATEVGYGALRWQGVLDAVIGAGSKRPVDRLDPPVRAILRIGAYQLLHMRVPQHAAVSATVELTRSEGVARSTGFVNAVLRRVGERSWEQWIDALAPSESADPVGRAAFAHGYPGWIARLFLDALDGDVDRLATELRADRPVTHLVARPGRLSRDALLAEAGDGARPGALSPYAVILDHGDPHTLASVRAGRAAVQDEGSQVVTVALAEVAVEGPDQRWLDMCAGPGGKAALLAGLGGDRGVHLLAADRAPHRAGLAAQALRGQDRSLTITADSAVPPWRPGKFDRVLLDAPCSGLGALRRRPEVRWRRTPADVDRLVPLQRALLTQALDAVRPGGVVGYVTCSPHPAETRDLVYDVLRERPHYRVEPVPTNLSASDAFPFRQLWPGRDGTDAMFLAVIRRSMAYRP